ncbi:MAG: urease subunit alpha [Clostridiales Family XIII bacterium]|jgi:urease subunit alpha|nr:urease subunit alpha [Clostridiales Family XIII bacterium]
MSREISRIDYYRLYGPTTGDRIALGDTGLMIEIEKDFCADAYGDECIAGGGKCARDGMGLISGVVSGPGEEEALDVVFTNMVIMDPVLGVVKGDIGVKNGVIVGVGKAGNPNTMDITPGMTVSAATEIISGGGGLIATPGGIDCHVHFQGPEQAWECLANGVTTMIGGGTGAKTLTIAVPATSVKSMILAHEALPVNAGILGRAESALPEVIEEACKSGVAGLKLHEDWGATPETIRASLSVADKYDCQLQIHTDTLNEAGNVEDTVAAIGGRTIHAYHVEGAGGGHAPDTLELVSLPNVIPSSTNPTNPHTVNVAEEHLEMILTVHHLNRNLQEDVDFAASRIRETTIAAEDILHDMGAISIMSSDSQGMGRAGETVLSAWQLAAKMKEQRGPLPEDENGSDNTRALRYLAKYTVNPAIVMGIDEYVGSIRPGRMADIVVWKKEFFGAKPEFVLKRGFMVMSPIGDSNASTKMSEPMLYRRQFGAYGGNVNDLCRVFVTQASIDNGIEEKIPTSKGKFLPVKNTRRLTKGDMVRNDALPEVKVDKETYEVTIDGKKVEPQPWSEAPLSQKYFFR